MCPLALRKKVFQLGDALSQGLYFIQVILTHVVSQLSDDSKNGLARPAF